MSRGLRNRCLGPVTWRWQALGTGAGRGQLRTAGGWELGQCLHRDGEGLAGEHAHSDPGTRAQAPCER